jgi:hypothetical protein
VTDNDQDLPAPLDGLGSGALVPVTPPAGSRRKAGAKMGRPQIVVNWNLVTALCEIQATLEEIVAVVKISEATLERACKREHRRTFADFSREKRRGGFISLRRAQWNRAIGGSDTMLIWMGKQHLGQKDIRVEEIKTEKPNISISFGVVDGPTAAGAEASAIPAKQG